MRMVKGLIPVFLLLLIPGLWPGVTQAASRRRAAQTIYLRDEDGSLLGRSRYVWFTNQRVLAPVSAFERLGFRVSRDFKRRRVRITPPGRGEGFTFAVGQRGVAEPDLATSDRGLVRYERPMLQLRGREFYIAAIPMKDYFPSLVSARWDRRTRTVTLQRTHELNRLRKLMN